MRYKKMESMDMGFLHPKKVYEVKNYVSSSFCLNTERACRGYW